MMMSVLNGLLGIIEPVHTPRQRLSDLLGSASFIVWLFAQSPQLYENYKNGSCDGLSVVFLVQWMLGDVTNLIGSVLTHQLPFQIAIATYFCCVDACILVQYGYYWRKEASLRRRQSRLAKRISQRSRTLDSRFNDYYYVHADERREMSVHPVEQLDASTERPTGKFYRRNLPMPEANVGRDVRRTHRGHESEGIRPLLAHRALTMDTDKNYRALGEAARSVAQLANVTEGRLAERRARQKWSWTMARLKATRRLAEPTERIPGTSALHDNQSEDGEVHWPDDMAASISTQSVSSGHSGDQQPLFGSASTPDVRRSDRPTPGSPSSRRGRGMTRMAGMVEAAVAARNPSLVQSVPSSPNEPRRQRTRPNVSRSSTRSSLSTLAAKPPGFILLGVAFFFAFGTIPFYQPNDIPIAAANGVASSHRMRVLSDKTWADQRYAGTKGLGGFKEDKLALTWQNPTWSAVDSTGGQSDPPPSWDRAVGRLSAWSCTVLYMTSRMPQIWTNMQRRSVQGLSIMLFIAAATGNLLYTLSILSNPQAQSPPRSPLERRAYIMESLPFLLGSGGTLIFDAIIVAQWTAWRGKAPQIGADVHAADLPTGNLLGSRSRSRKTSTQSRWHSLERQSLLT
jgi:uncharacterized protein with PQ loop repeat